jgi:outer membrane lipoprotein carrier protein
MKKFILATLLLVSSVTFASEPVENLITELKHFDRLTAKFNQQVSTDHRGSAQKSQGNFALERPGKFFWETKSPTQQKIIADGKTIWVYDVDLEQVTRQAQQTTNQNSPAIFLTGDLGQINARFIVKEASPGIFFLKAKSPEDMFQSIELTFKANKLARMKVNTKMGQDSDFKFTDVVINPDLGKDLFHFKPPKGIDIISND